MVGTWMHSRSLELLPSLVCALPSPGCVARFPFTFCRRGWRSLCGHKRPNVFTHLDVVELAVASGRTSSRVSFGRVFAVSWLPGRTTTYFPHGVFGLVAHPVVVFVFPHTDTSGAGARAGFSLILHLPIVHNYALIWICVEHWIWRRE